MMLALRVVLSPPRNSRVLLTGVSSAKSSRQGGLYLRCRFPRARWFRSIASTSSVYLLVPFTRVRGARFSLLLGVFGIFCYSCGLPALFAVMRCLLLDTGHWTLDTGIPAAPRLDEPAARASSTTHGTKRKEIYHVGSARTPRDTSEVATRD
jgi:hypothetical protein